MRKIRYLNANHSAEIGNSRKQVFPKPFDKYKYKILFASLKFSVEFFCFKGFMMRAGII